MEDYDSHSVFSPDGRITQVEYAHNASNQGSLVTFAANKEIIISIEIRSPPLCHPPTKLFCLNTELNYFYSFSGLSSDAQKIVDFARAKTTNYFLQYSVPISVDILCKEIAKYKQSFTIESGKRPFGVRSILFGFSGEAEVFVVEPDGNYSAYKRGAIGSNSEKAIEYLVGADSDGSPAFVALGALAAAVQTGKNKIECFRLTKNKIEKLDEHEINSVLRETGSLDLKGQHVLSDANLIK